jgi:hypothetical protein
MKRANQHRNLAEENNGPILGVELKVEEENEGDDYNKFNWEVVKAENSTNVLELQINF